MFPAIAAARLPLQLTPEQCDEYTQVAYCVRDHVVALNEAHLARARDAPAFDSRDWKLIKKKEHFKIFASRQKHHTTAYPKANRHVAMSEVHRSADWKPQTILGCLGTYIGTLDDAMYGGVTPTDKDMLIRSITIQDDMVDHKTLCNIALPTEDDPFLNIGLKWSARSSSLATIVKARDFAYVQATGLCTIHNKGTPERAGYLVYHSMENIPGIPEFNEHNIRRCRFSLSIIMRPTSATTIDVFSTIATDAGGDLPRNLTTLLAASSLMGIHKAMDNSLKKKLVWLRAARSHAIWRGSDLISSLAPARRDSFMGTSFAVCPQCTRELLVFQPLVLCHVCEAKVCSRCMTTQKLVLGPTAAELAQVHVPTCKGCITTAAKIDVRDLAIFDFVRPFDFDFEGLPSVQSITTDVSRGFSFFGLRVSTPLSLSRSDRSSHTSFTSHSSRSSVPNSVSDEHDRLCTQIYNLRLQAERTSHATNLRSPGAQQQEQFYRL